MTESQGEYSVDDEDQLQAEDTLEDRGSTTSSTRASPRARTGRWVRASATPRPRSTQGETLDQRLRQEEPEVDPATDTWDEEDLDDGEVGDERSGRLIASDEGDDRFVEDAGIDGAGASAEEAAMHVIDE